MPVFLSKVWEYIKRHWSVLLIVALVVVGYFYFRHQSSTFADQMKQVQTIHSEELNKISAAREEEQQKHAANIKQLQDSLDAAQHRYDEALKDLDAAKKAQAAAIIKQYGNDPVALAQKLSEVTGFRVINP